MYYWDSWYEDAVARGVNEDLAQFGRQIMRDHFQHGKGDWLLGEESDGSEMLRMCLDDPDAAHARFKEELPDFPVSTNDQ
jgi:hypothetical protein